MQQEKRLHGISTLQNREYIRRHKPYLSTKYRIMSSDSYIEAPVFGST